MFVAKVDCDAVRTVQAGFNVLPDDIVKAYIVNDLINTVYFNPTILQLSSYACRGQSVPNAYVL